MYIHFHIYDLIGVCICKKEENSLENIYSKTQYATACEPRSHLMPSRGITLEVGGRRPKMRPKYMKGDISQLSWNIIIV